METSSNYFVNYFSCNTKFNLFGNIESLNGYDGSYQGLDLYQYYHLFAHSNVVSAKHLILGRSDTDLEPYCYEGLFWRSTLIEPPKLPMMNLSENCYLNMFGECINLILPEDFTLPATTLSNSCYHLMFYNCTSLNILPSNLLPAITLSSFCYLDMFSNCISLTTAPVLPAITLVSQCYSGMFYNCKNLNYVKAMFTTTPSSAYTNDWVYGVSSSGIFVKNSAAT
jgi:hypothetical protein